MFHIILAFAILLVREPAKCCLAKDIHASFGCIAEEREALQKFRESLSDPSLRLSSWNEDGCCSWQGVQCDKITGHVVVLDLGNIHADNDGMLHSELLDASVSKLKHLSYLDLSWNDFQLSSIPAFLGEMKQLQHLNLSSANFSGVVPHHLGNLSSLNTLDLSQGYQLIVDDFMWVSQLSLRYLDMTLVDLSRTKDLLKVLSMVPSILVLTLSGSSLDNTNLEHGCANYSVAFIQELDLSFNMFDGEFPCFLHNMSSLTHLDLSYNQYESSNLHLRRLRNIVQLNLGGNMLHHKVDWITELLKYKCNLKSLDLSLNRFYGEISVIFLNLSGCWKQKLERLILSYNPFYGSLPEVFGKFKNLQYFHLSGGLISGPIPASFGDLSTMTELYLFQNAFSGSIPSTLGKLKALRVLSISYNQLSGAIPSSLGNLSALKALSLRNNQLAGVIPLSLGQLSNLENIDLSSNSLDGMLSEAHFAKLAKLNYLRISSNLLNFTVGFDWVPPFQLEHLMMRSCNVGGQFPHWLQTQRKLTVLDLSNCSISGALPEWLHHLNLSQLDLPRPIVHLTDNIGYVMPLLEDLNLAQNNINGSMPKSLCEMKSLQSLDLSRNGLSGNLPDCFMNLKALRVLRLSSNELSGVIPDSIGGAVSLQWLHLNNNSFTGKIPSALRNCIQLIVLDIGENKISGKLPKWIGKYLLHLAVLRLRTNQFYGTVSSDFCLLRELQIMDLAINKLTGNIPHCFGNFSGMKKFLGELPMPFDEEWYQETFKQVIKGLELEFTTTSVLVVNMDLSSNNLVGEIPPELTNLSGLLGLNLSHNHLECKIPESIGNMESLESLDLSNNHLFGIIPGTLSDLSSLSHLNLSYNNLSGPIPAGPQLQTIEDPSAYEGNPGLCGAPLQKKCHDGDTSKAPSAADEGDETNKVWFYVFIVSGFATGFVGILVFERSWRQACFLFVESRIGRMLGK